MQVSEGVDSPNIFKVNFEKSVRQNLFAIMDEGNVTKITRLAIPILFWKSRRVIFKFAFDVTWWEG